MLMFRYKHTLAFPGGSVINSSPANTRDARDAGSVPWFVRSWQPAPVLLPGKSHGQRSLGGSQRDTTTHVHS